MNNTIPNLPEETSHPPSDLPSRRTVLLIAGLALILATLFGGIFFRRAIISAESSHHPLPIYGQLQEFSLIERTGKPFGSRDLHGNVWIADFIFTRCAGPCPAMTMKMRELQAGFEGFSGIKLVSFSVDPEHDTPQELSEYARQFHAKDGIWYFLTGHPEAVRAVALENFKIILQQNKPDQRQEDEGAILHSTHFILIDGKGRVRGYYDSSKPGALKKIREDALRLQQQEQKGVS